MKREIEQQPEALRRTLDAVLPELPALCRLGEQTRQVLFVARGSSDNAAVYGSYLCEVAAGRLATLSSPSVATTYRSRLDLSGVLAVALSQSGRTEEIVQTMAWAADCGARTVAVTNDAESPLAEAAEVTLCTQAGVEQAVPATKTYTTQLAALAVLGLALCGDDQGFRAALHEVPDAVEAMLQPRGDFAEMVARLAAVDGLVVSGRGYAYSTALEVALKFKETSYRTAEGLSYADLLHGPIAVLDGDTPVLLVAPADGPVLPGLVTLARRARELDSATLLLGGDAGLAAACDASVAGPQLPEFLAPIGLVVPGQLLTEAVAVTTGIDPDTPRGLRKVTQTDGAE
ncbi:MAG: SIS domain-containing protein [Streptosporangiales bacterium]|nr:SIS domain-containing protein [Streptosporangiales bacterium]